MYHGDDNFGGGIAMIFRFIAVFAFLFFDQSVLGMYSGCYTPTETSLAKQLYESSLNKCHVDKAQQAINKISCFNSNSSIKDTVTCAVNSVNESIRLLSDLSIDDEHIEEQIRKRVFSLFFDLRDKIKALRFRMKFLNKNDKDYINGLVEPLTSSPQL